MEGGHDERPSGVALAPGAVHGLLVDLAGVCAASGCLGHLGCGRRPGLLHLCRREVQERQATWNTNSDAASGWTSVGRWRSAASRPMTRRVTRLRGPADTLVGVAEPGRGGISGQGTHERRPAGRQSGLLLLYGPGWFVAVGVGRGRRGLDNLDDPDDQVVAMCVFPDGSTIDEWGLAYHSDDVVPGCRSGATVPRGHGGLPAHLRGQRRRCPRGRGQHRSQCRACGTPAPHPRPTPRPLVPPLPARRRRRSPPPRAAWSR